MKKSLKLFVSLLSSVILAVSSLPVCSFAEEYLTGDVNCDGIINSEDAQLILEYYAKNNTGKLYEMDSTDIENIVKYGDVNGDGEINASDAAQVYVIEEKNADINGDGIVNSDDLYLILDYYTKISGGKVDNLTDTDIENVLKHGDLNGDGDIDASDGSALIIIAMKSIDVNGDGIINIDDAMYIYDFAVNIDSHTLEEVEAVTKLTANVRYYPDTQYVKPDLMNYAFALAERITDLKKGDATGDGNLNASDASYVLSIYSKLSSGGLGLDKNSSEYKIARIFGDINGDGVINASDASEILSAYAKISSGSVK